MANGAVFRYEPRTQKFDVYVSFGFANPHGHVFERWGQDIVFDGTGADPYHALLFSGDVDFPHKHGRPPQVYKQRTRPCSGVEILSSSHFPEEFRGNLLVLNVIGFQGILQYKLAGQGFELRRRPKSSRSCPRPTRTSARPTSRSGPTDRSTSPTGRTRSSATCSTTCAIPAATGRTAASTASATKAANCCKPAPIAGEPIDKLLDLLKSPGRPRPLSGPDRTVGPPDRPT